MAGLVVAGHGRANRAWSAAFFSGATRPSPLARLCARFESKGNGRVAPLKNAALQALLALP